MLIPNLGNPGQSGPHPFRGVSSGLVPPRNNYPPPLGEGWYRRKIFSRGGPSERVAPGFSGITQYPFYDMDHWYGFVDYMVTVWGALVFDKSHIIPLRHFQFFVAHLTIAILHAYQLFWGSKLSTVVFSNIFEPPINNHPKSEEGKCLCPSQERSQERN